MAETVDRPSLTMHFEHEHQRGQVAKLICEKIVRCLEYKRQEEAEQYYTALKRMYGITF